MAQFDDLSDYDFELLVADLLGAEWDRAFETFSRGRDGGIDLRARLPNGTHLVQCKHYALSSIATLIRAAEKERQQLSGRRPKPRRYTFVTSRRLTPSSKEKLLQALAPFATSERSILGAEDLAAMLRRHPDVERAHVKLWLRGVAVLDRIVNADIHARSEALMADVLAALPRYVQTPSFRDAHALLVEHNVVIIAGPPGVGKTTLARLLLLDAVQAGYTPYGIQADVTEAWRLHRDDEAQVFFFDDFLGRTALFDSVDGDPRDLASLIRQVRRSKTTRLILATREYVLQQAKLQVEDLKWQKLEADKYALTLERYGRFDRARIFYNHVYFSPDVDAVAIGDLLQRRAYIDVINHPSYSPRLIEWMTGLGGHTLTAENRREFAKFCISVLDDPQSLWLYAYSRGLTDTERCLLLQLPGLKADVPLQDLEDAYRLAAEHRGLPAGHSGFEAALKVVQDSFVSIRDWGRNQVLVSALNPSLIDFLKQQLLDEPTEIAVALGGSRFFGQVAVLHELAVESGRPPEGWAPQLAEAVERTFREGEGRDPTPATPRGGDEVEERLRRIVDWCRQDGRVTGYLEPFVTAFLAEREEEIGGRGASVLAYWPKTLVELDAVGFEVRELLSALTERAVESDTLYGYEALCDLRPVEPPLLSIREWADIQDRFTSWAEGCLEESSGWFDDMDEFSRFEDTAEVLSVSLNEDALTAARDEMYEVQAEREAEARAGIDPDYERDEYERPTSTDWDQVDALFGMLGN